MPLQRASRAQRQPPRSLRTSALLVGGITAAASVVALARDVIVSRFAGFGVELDIWALALAATTVAMSSVVSGIAAAVVPLFGQTGRASDESAAQGGSTDVLVAASAAGIVLAAASWLAATPVASLLASSVDERPLASVLRVMSVMVITPAALRGAAAALLQARHHFVAPALGTVLSYLCVIIAALSGTITAERLAVAHGIGVILEAAVLVAVVARIDGSAASLAGIRSISRKAGRAVGTTALAALLFGLGPVIDLWFAGRVGAGQAGQLAVAGRVPLAIAAVLTTAFATPAFPMIVHRAQHGVRSAWLATREAVGSTKWTSSGTTALVIALSIPTAALAFRGSQVSSDEARSVAVVQMLYALTIPTYVAGTLYARGLQAVGRHSTVLWVGVLGSIVNAALDWSLSEVWGLRGIALSTAAVYAFTLWSMRLTLSRLARHADHIG